MSCYLTYIDNSIYILTGAVSEKAGRGRRGNSAPLPQIRGGF